MTIQKIEAKPDKENDKKESGFRGLPHLSVETQILYDRLLKLQIGEQVNYDELSDLIQQDVHSEARGKLYSAFRILLNNHRINIETVRGFGVRRLTDVETVMASSGFVRHVRKTMRKGLRKLGTVADFAAMPQEARNRHNAQVTALRLIGLMTRPGRIMKIEAMVSAINRPLQIAETLKLFEKKEG